MRDSLRAANSLRYTDRSMKRTLGIILMTVICCAAAITSPAQQSYEPPLTNAAVVKLVRAGFKEKTVITIIRSRPTRFNLEPDKLIELKKSGVSENIILAMLAQDESFVFNDDDWSAELHASRKHEQAWEGSERTVRRGHFWQRLELE